ncbi:MAG: phenylacetate--CoA ligase family protein, partial [Pirellulaceae bacterium]
VPAVRQLIETRWQAQVIDHCGATEIGPWGFGWPDRLGLHIIETSFIAELIPLGPPGMHELILTSLGRYGAPVLRYRTGDVVNAERPLSGDCRFLWLPQGVIGRADDMVTIRGVNIFPSSLDAIVREFPAISEYRACVTRREHLDELELEIEVLVGQEASVQALFEKLLTSRLGLRIPVRLAPTGSLPRSEGKSNRWQDRRASNAL